MAHGDMSPKSFSARMARCGNRTRESAIAKTRALLQHPGLSADQRGVAEARLEQLRRWCGDTSVVIAPAVSDAMKAEALALMVHREKVLSVTDAGFRELHSFMKDCVAPTPNPRNPSTYLRRKQCTFTTPGTAAYTFAGQFNQHFCTVVSEWPTAVRDALTYVRTMPEHAEDKYFYTAVHVNIYEDGGVGVNPHQDNETNMVQDKPIYSFTLLEDPSTPRDFQIYDTNKSKLVAVPLGHRDLLVMKPGMQSRFFHGIEKVRPFKRFKPRINLTVRAVKEASP